MASVNTRIVAIIIIALVTGLGFGSQAFPKTERQVISVTVTESATVTAMRFNVCPLTPFSLEHPPVMGGESSYASLPAQWWTNENGTLWAFPFNSNATHAGYGEGMKILWVRTDGGTFEQHQLVIDSIQLDGHAAPLNATIPNGYDSNYQASELFFPKQGCWKVTGIVEKNSLSFVVYVYP